MTEFDFERKKKSLAGKRYWIRKQRESSIETVKDGAIESENQTNLKG